MSENRRELEASVHHALTTGSTYGDYLHLDELLAAQRPVTTVHDELQFIIQHHTSELWSKLLLHELDLAVQLVRSDRRGETFKIFARVAHIKRLLYEQWAVLETMTPSEYLQFRDALGKASGFQSNQYRALEFVLGNKDAITVKPHGLDPLVHADLLARLAAPSLYDEFLRWVARHGHAIPADRLERDFTQPYTRCDAVLAVFRTIYAEPDQHYAAYDMCEKLVDIEERFQLWRFRHMTTVKRIIGFARGTGGSSGVAFLEQALGLTFFPELWDVRTHLAAPAKR